MSNEKEKEFFSKKFLVVLLAFSILTNIVMIGKQRYPHFFTRVQVALLPAPKVMADDHVRGNPNAKYTVIEYADFQCPYCTRFHDAMLSLMKEADVRWVFRHFPLQNHPLAQKAAEASECAGEQGKFWEYTDALFQTKGALKEETLFSLAKKLRLDGLSFGVCLNTGKFSKRVAEQREDGLKKKIKGTPSFYLNDKRFDGFVPLEELRKMTGVKEKE
jgi:protein-disulfide isomerase